MSLHSCPKCKQRVRVITKKVMNKKKILGWGYYCIECKALIKFEDAD